MNYFSKRGVIAKMKSFGDKVREARISLGMAPKQLAEEIGVSLRSVHCYERNEKTPRQTTMAKLAKALQVSVKFLSDDECEDPVADIEKDNYIEEARERYGSKGARDVEQLLAVEEIPARHRRQVLAAGNDADLRVLHDANLVIFFHFGK